MNEATKRYSLAWFIPMILVQVHSASLIQETPRNAINHSCKTVRECEWTYDGSAKSIPSNTKSISDIFYRNAKARNQSPTFSIDLSQLRGKSASNSGSRFKSPPNMLGIDISVLSQNPDPALPRAKLNPENIINGKHILNYKIHPQYDRFPVRKTNLNPKYPSFPQVQSFEMKPVIYLPLKIMRAYHSTLADKKQDSGFYIRNNGELGRIENEQKYTAHFLSNLLHQLSSNY